MHLNVSVSVRFVALFVVAVLNGVVLIAHMNQRGAEGHALCDAVREGAGVRLRPMRITALVASVGLLPMALSTSAGSEVQRPEVQRPEVQRPLASVVVGRLISATLLTRCVLTTVYTWLEE